MTDEPSRHEYGFATRAVHGGRDAYRDGTGGVVPPIQLSTTFERERVGGDEEYVYSRTGSPTRDALEARLAALEGADHAAAFASGMAAIASTCLALLEPGDRVVAFDSLYGGTRVFLDDVLADWGVEVTYVDATDLDALAAALEGRDGGEGGGGDGGGGERGMDAAPASLCWLETPTNPLLKLCDLEAASALAAAVGARTVVDNTFASPYRQRPLELGADAVVYSTTKFLNGHSDALGGAVLADDDALAEAVAFQQGFGLGATPGPLDCYLTLRGTTTLPARMDAHERNARAVAEFLADHSAVERVRWPGLASHPQHDLARRQMDGFGGVVSFELDADGATARAVVESLEVFTLAVSLGGVESLVEHTASMSAGYLTPAQRRAAGVTESLVRAPVGVEDPADLLADLDRALSRV
jgi:cystathionine beta-lyase/cystathionine gamma-synthase